MRQRLLRSKVQLTDPDARLRNQRQNPEVEGMLASRRQHRFAPVAEKPDDRQRQAGAAADRQVDLEPEQLNREPVGHPACYQDGERTLGFVHRFHNL